MADTISSLTSKGLTDAISKGVSDGINSATKNKMPDLSANAGYQSHDDLAAWHNKQYGLDDESKNRTAIEKLSEEQKNFTKQFEHFAKQIDAMSSDVAKKIAGSKQESSWSKIMADSERDEVVKIDSLAPMRLMRTLSSFVGRTGDTSMQRTAEDTVTRNPIEKEKDTSISQRIRGSENAGDKRQATEKDNLRYEEQKVYQDKVLKSLDEFKEFVYSGTEGDGIKIKGGDGSGGDGGLLNGLLGAAGFVAGAAVGVIFAKVRNAAKIWGEVFHAGAAKIGEKIKGAWKWFTETDFGKKLTENIEKIKKRLSEVKSSMLKTFEEWKAAAKESWIGKTVQKAKNLVSNTAEKLANSSLGKWLGKKTDAIKAAYKEGGLLGMAGKAASKVEKIPGIGTAMKAGKFGFKAASKVLNAPVELALRNVDSIKNAYDVYKKTGNMTSAAAYMGGGMIDSVLDTAMIPELVNGLKHVYRSSKDGKGVWDSVKSFGTGVMEERDPDKISWGQQVAGLAQVIAGEDNETTRRLAMGGKYSERGLKAVNGNAFGLGHTAAVYDPKYEQELFERRMKAKLAAGSLENSKEPTAELTDKKITGEVTASADMNKTLIEGIKAGVKDAYLSPEVQAAQMNQAKETGKEIRTTLVG